MTHDPRRDRHGHRREGREVAGRVELGIVQEDRNSEGFLGERTVGTNADGRFTFVNVPPDETWQLYGLMKSLRPHGALASRPLKVGGGRVDADVHDLVLFLEPGVRTFELPAPDAGIWERYQALGKAPLRGAPIEALAPQLGK